jgi:hypothetical protein
MPETGFDRRYIGGYLLGGSMLLVGLFYVVSWLLPGEAAIGMLLFGLWYAVAGFGLTRKTFYGVVMFYMAALNALVSFFYPHWDSLLLHVLVLLWLGLPAIFYYRRFEQLAAGSLSKWDWRGKKRQAVLPEIPTRSLSDEEVKQVFEHIQERRKAKQREPMQ